MVYMRVRANTVAYNETAEVDKSLPEVTQSRKELIEGVKSTVVYMAKSKDEFADCLREVVKNAEQRGRLYGKDIEATSTNFIRHLDQLRNIGEALNPKSGRYTGRANFNPRTESKSQGTGLEFSPEDRDKLVRFLTSEYNLCKREIARVDRAIDASEKAYANFVLYSTGMSALTPNRTGYAEDRPENFIKIRYHKMQERHYNRAADDYHKSAQCYSEAQYYDSAIKQHKNPELVKEDLALRNEIMASHQGNAEISRLIDEEKSNSNNYVTTEIKLVLEENGSKKDRIELASATHLVTGAKFRETNGLTKDKLIILKETVSESNGITKSQQSAQGALNKERLVISGKIAAAKKEVLSSAARFGKDQNEDEKKYKILITQSEYLQEFAAKSISKAATDIDSYTLNDYALKSSLEQIENENVSIRLAVTKFKELKTTVTEFRDNLRGFVNSVVPIERAPDKSAHTPVTRKVLRTTEGEASSAKNVPTGAAGMMRARQSRIEADATDNANESKNNSPKNEPREFKI